MFRSTTVVSGENIVRILLILSVSFIMAVSATAFGQAIKIEPVANPAGESSSQQRDSMRFDPR